MAARPLLGGTDHAFAFVSRELALVARLVGTRQRYNRWHAVLLALRVHAIDAVLADRFAFALDRNARHAHRVEREDALAAETVAVTDRIHACRLTRTVTRD